MKYNTVKSVLAAFALTSATSLHAADINFSGFATIAAGTTTSSDEAYAGYTNDLDFNQGSLFALQTSSQLSDGLSVTAQLIARGKDDWEPAFEWAFLAYELNDDWRILAGRQRAPFFTFSDYLDVSYAYHWITPPAGVYNLAFDSFDGIGAIYNTQWGDTDNTFHFIGGRNKDEFQLQSGDSIKPDFNKVLGVAWTLNQDWLTLRAGYFQTEFTMHIPALDGLIAGWDNAGFSELSNNLKAEEDDAWFAQLGFQIDYDDYLIVGEFTRLDLTNSGFSNDDSYYISFGKRFDAVMVHLTYGADDDEMENMLANIPNIAALAPLYTPTAGIIAGEHKKQKYITAGVKWDFHEVASMKFEVTQLDDSLNSDNDATLINVALVTVF